VAALGALGWLPGGLVFPLIIHLTAGPLPWQTFAHFMVSFTMAGFDRRGVQLPGIQYVVFRALLPRLGTRIRTRRRRCGPRSAR